MGTFPPTPWRCSAGTRPRTFPAEWRPRHRWDKESKRPTWDSSVQTTSYGLLSGGGERRCKYADSNQEHILSSSTIDILVGDQSRVGLKWLGRSGRPSEAEIREGRAIPCHLNFGTYSDCYFGQGVYSDGICDEVGSELTFFIIYN